MENIIKDSELLIYVPEENEFMFLSEGTGDNLLPEDRKQGYIDYIEIYTYRYTGDMNYPLEESDGGELLLKKSFNGFDKKLINECLAEMYEKSSKYIMIRQK